MLIHSERFVYRWATNKGRINNVYDFAIIDDARGRKSA